jgi:hypothetical protein
MGAKYTEEKKLVVSKEIVDTIHRICTGDAGTCCFGYCIFNHQCAKPNFELAALIKKKNIRLKGILKNVRAKERKKLGITQPPDKQKQKLERSLKWAVNRILGENIYDHYLIKGNERAISQIDICKNIKEVVLVLGERYEEVHGKKASLPGGSRYKYWFYKNENKSE